VGVPFFCVCEIEFVLKSCVDFVFWWDIVVGCLVPSLQSFGGSKNETLTKTLYFVWLHKSRDKETLIQKLSGKL